MSVQDDISAAWRAVDRELAAPSSIELSSEERAIVLGRAEAIDASVKKYFASDVRPLWRIWHDA